MTMDNTALVARTRANEHPGELMHAAVTDAVLYIKAGQPEDALRRLTDSVLGEQARAAGIRVEQP